MTYRMAAIDLDGTLLTDAKTISEGNLRALKEAAEAGVIVCISTGRAWPGAREFARQAGVIHPVITSNGAMIMDPVKEEIFFERDLGSEEALTIIREGEARDTSQIIWSKNRLYGLPLNERLADYEQRFGRIKASAVPDLEKLAAEGIQKVLWYDDRDTIAEWAGDNPMLGRESVTVCTSDPHFLEFFSSTVSKAEAIGKVAGMYGISLEEIMAFGDAGNDLPMLAAAGLGVAMGNATEQVKAAAGFVTKSNEEDGVAYALRHFGVI